MKTIPQKLTFDGTKHEALHRDSKRTTPTVKQRTREFSERRKFNFLDAAARSEK